MLNKCYKNVDVLQTRSSTKAKGLEMKQTIAPMSMANFLLMSKKQQRAVVGDEALKKVAAAFKAVEQGIHILSICTYPLVILCYFIRI